MNPPDPITRLNAALEGRYRIERELGEGGMATVYLADDLKHERKVALKVLKPELAAVVGAERFLAEIKTTANLQHPHILPLFDSGEADGFVFYVMPYVEGESLGDKLDREHQLPVDDAVRIASDVAEALDYAHSHDVIHRDIKPANILIQAGRPVIADFGIALAISAGGANRLTETGLSVGTPHYMSPEQATGDQTTGPATDTYALGCVLYEMLVGEPPYTGSTAQAILGKIIAGELAPATQERASVPANVDAAIRKALEKLPADRFTSTQDFAKALADPGFRHGALAGSVAGVTPGPWNRLTVAMTALSAGLVLTLAVTVVVLISTRPTGVPVVYDVALPDEAPMSFTGGSRDGIGNPAFSLSPSGDFVVYVAEREEGTELWYRSLMDTEAHSIEGTKGAYYPMVSPDGEWVAFFSGAQLRRVPIGGGEAVPLLDVATLGPAGHWASMDRILVHDQFNRIRIVDPTTRETITRATQTGRCSLPYVLETEHVLCNDAFGARALHRDSTSTHGLQRGGQRVSGSSLRFLSDGYLTYVTSEGALQIAPFDPETLQLDRPATVLQGLRRETDAGAAHYSVTPDGALVYAPGENAEEGRLVLARGEGLPEYLPVDAAPFLTFDLSPDGERLAAVVVGLAGRELWVYTLPTGRKVRWLSSSNMTEPRWAPGGEMLAVSTWSETLGRMVIVVGDPRLGPPSDTVDSSLGPSQFISESRLLIGSSSLTPAAVVDLSTGPPTIDTVLDFAAGWPALSPDGRWMSYTSRGTGRAEVFIESFPQAERRYTVSADEGQEQLWLSATELAYRLGRSWYTVSVPDRPDQPPAQPLLWFSDDRFMDTSGRSHALAPDRGVVYVQGTARSTASFLRVVPNWAEGAKRAADDANRR